MAKIRIRKWHMFRSPKTNVSTLFYDRLKMCFFLLFFLVYSSLFFFYFLFQTNTASSFLYFTCQDISSIRTLRHVVLQPAERLLISKAVKVSTKCIGTSSWLQLHEEIQHDREGLRHFEAYIFFCFFYNFYVPKLYKYFIYFFIFVFYFLI